MVLEQAFPVLAVSDLDASAAYYAEALGFNVSWRWGEPTVRLGVVRDAVELQLVQAGTRGAPPGPAVVYCHVRDAEAYHEACVASGARIVTALSSRDYGMRDFRVRDLDDNTIGFGERVARG